MKPHSFIALARTARAWPGPLLALFLVAACVDSKTTSDVSTGTGPPACTGGASVSGTIWVDQDCDGVQEPGEAPLEDVLVRLFDEGGAFLDEQATAPDGVYSFDVDELGTYTVEADPGSLAQAYAPCSAASGQVVIASGSCNPSLDFGFTCANAVGDRVWFDANEDGRQEAGEPGLESVRIVLSDPAGGFLDDTWSGPLGEWSFTDLAPGTYSIAVDPASLPPGLLPTACDVGGNPLADSDCSPALVALACGDLDLSVDFGFVGPAGRIGDFVWYDANGDGLQDPGEGFDCARVALMDDQGGPTRFVTTTNNGRYGFYGLAAGTYTVWVVEDTLPPGFVPTLCDVGGDALDAEDSDCLPVLVTLGPDEVDATVDFGYVAGCASGRVGDRVWVDLDHDGIQDDGEPGFNGVPLILRDASSGQKLMAVSTAPVAEAQGRYSFPGVCAGTYTVELDLSGLPPGWTLTTCEVGTDDAVDSNCSPAQVVLEDGVLLSTIDFGLIPPGFASIGDFVWDDTRGDVRGQQDWNEPGLAGVGVSLRDDQYREIGSTTSDAAGAYEFAHLAAGDYWVEVEQPEGFHPAECDASVDSLDSECSPASVTLPTDGTQDDTVDFGFIEPTGYIGRFVWKDENRDGDFDAGPCEPGLAGVRVLLKDAATDLVLDECATNAAGFYVFDGLSAGAYVVEVDVATLPPGFTQTLCEAWPDPGAPTEGGGLEGGGCDDGDGTIDNVCNPATVVLVTDSARFLNIDFGFALP